MGVVHHHGICPKKGDPSLPMRVVWAFRKTVGLVCHARAGLNCQPQDVLIFHTKVDPNCRTQGVLIFHTKVGPIHRMQDLPFFHTKVGLNRRTQDVLISHTRVDPISLQTLRIGRSDLDRQYPRFDHLGRRGPDLQHDVSDVLPASYAFPHDPALRELPSSEASCRSLARFQLKDRDPLT